VQREMTPKQLRAARKRLGLSLSEIADLLPCDRQSWHRWEQGTVRPPRFIWRALRDLERERNPNAEQNDG
jgi:DNA-binding transcriptional regulator YiaG